MKRWILPLLVAIIALIIIVRAVQPAPQPTYADIQRAQLAAEQAAQVAPAWTIASYIFIVGFPSALLLFTVLAGAVLLTRFRNERKADRLGRLPVLQTPATREHYLALSAGTYMGGIDVERLRAIHQPGQTPASVHYSPNYSRAITTDATRFLDGSDLDTAPLLNAAPVPTFAELLDQGRIGRGLPILMGFDEQHQPYETSFSLLYSSQTNGISGSGKSSTVASLAAQSALNGAKLVLIDIAAGDEQSLYNKLAPLAPSFLYAMTDELDQVIGTLQAINGIVMRRNSGEDTARGNILVLIDEWTSTLALLGKDEATAVDLLGNITRMGRKLGVFAFAIGQTAGADSTGGSKLRNTFASQLVHRMRKDEAKMMTGYPSRLLPDDTLELHQGQYYLYNNRGERHKIQSPYMTDQDVQRVGQLLLGDGTENLYDLGRSANAKNVSVDIPDDRNGMPTVSQKYANGTQAYPAVETSKPVSVESAEVKRLFFAEHLDPSEIVYRLRGVKTSEGKRYQTALKDVLDLLRQGMSGA